MKQRTNSIRLIVFLNLFLLISCLNKRTTNYSTLDFKEKGAGLERVINESDTLKIIVHFSECGEWGGHNEMILLQRTKTNEIEARLLVDTVSCDSIKDFIYFDLHTKDTFSYSAIEYKSRIRIIDITKTLTKNDEILINQFLHRIFELYLNQDRFKYDENSEIIPIYRGSGRSIHIENSNSTLKLDFSNIDESNNTWYWKVRLKIFGEKLKENEKSVANTPYTA
ncbi:MAG: hypothetical protein ACWA6U_17830 [Breznakibacter sp.]